MKIKYNLRLSVVIERDIKNSIILNKKTNHYLFHYSSYRV